MKNKKGKENYEKNTELNNYEEEAEKRKKNETNNELNKYEQETEREKQGKRFPQKKVSKTFDKVFDKETLDTIHKISTAGLFDVLEFVISTGKEAYVFRSTDKGGNFRAVKIYKTLTSDFHNMTKYIEGDKRFKNIPKEKKEIVIEWTKKEFKNLEKLSKAYASVPYPIGYKNNVLVMEFIGENGEASKTLKEAGVKDMENAYQQIVEFIARSFYLSNLIHADLSEYNILVKNFEGKEKLVVIDVGQAVLKSHPKAEEFLGRDLRNISNYFSKKGFEKSEEELRKDIRKWKEKLV
ncbi:MAG: serine protein kinase RIO [Candidatus Diapherotrites archaeon CG10_big_fil_rev_8_21_14_0_10_31_34]|nr:MAG: serine protein kinase RIO [Candidatus Diapherotrites archaeon CG10_big_fil_rev_8_21_14_0_10_31_34]